MRKSKRSKRKSGEERKKKDRKRCGRTGRGEEEERKDRRRRGRRGRGEEECEEEESFS